MTGAYKKAAGRKIFKIKQLRLGLWVQILSPRFNFLFKIKTLSSLNQIFSGASQAHGESGQQYNKSGGESAQKRKPSLRVNHRASIFPFNIFCGSFQWHTQYGQRSLQKKATIQLFLPSESRKELKCLQ